MYGCRSAFVLTPAFRLGFVMTTEMGFSPDGSGGEGMAFVTIVIHAVWDTKNREPYLVKDIGPLIVSHIKRCV